MKNIIVIGLISFSVFFQSSYYGSTLAPVTMAGAIIKTKSVDTFKKYKRKDCPVCKGKGWYISGDKISKVDCGYCEPEEGKSNQNNNQCETRVIKK